MEIKGFHPTRIQRLRLHFHCSLTHTPWVCVLLCVWVPVRCMQGASLIFISGHKSSGLCCGAGWRAAAAAAAWGWREKVGGSRGFFSRHSGFTGFWSPPHAGSHDAMPQWMNIFERKLLQLRQFISSCKSCGAAKDMIVSHTVLDVSGFWPNMADSVCHLQPPRLDRLVCLQQNKTLDEWK